MQTLNLEELRPVPTEGMPGEQHATVQLVVEVIIEPRAGSTLVRRWLGPVVELLAGGLANVEQAVEAKYVDRDLDMHMQEIADVIADNAVCEVDPEIGEVHPEPLMVESKIAISAQRSAME